MPLYQQARSEMERRPRVDCATLEYVQLVEQLVQILAVCQRKKAYIRRDWVDLEREVTDYLHGLYSRRFCRHGRQAELPDGVGESFWEA